MRAWVRSWVLMARSSRLVSRAVAVAWVFIVIGFGFLVVGLVELCVFDFILDLS